MIVGVLTAAVFLLFIACACLIVLSIRLLCLVQSGQGEWLKRLDEHCRKYDAKLEEFRSIVREMPWKDGGPVSSRGCG